MEDGLVPERAAGEQYEANGQVLILVVMEDGLVQEFDFLDRANAFGLNPCCNGRWSRTGV